MCKGTQTGYFCPPEPTAGADMAYAVRSGRVGVLVLVLVLVLVAGGRGGW